MMTLWLVNFFAIGFLVFLATVVLRSRCAVQLHENMSGKR